jgi:hypothetical protein
MRWLIFALLIAATVPCPGQDVGRAHGILFVELGGNAAFGATANLEVFLAGPVAVRGGAGVDLFSSTPVYPLQVVLLAGGGSSKLELAGGVTIAHEDPAYSGNWHWDGTKAFATGFFGYRYQRPRGLLFRIGVVPLLWTNAHIPWVAISLGTTF